MSDDLAASELKLNVEAAERCAVRSLVEFVQGSGGTVTGSLAHNWKIVSLDCDYRNRFASARRGALAQVCRRAVSRQRFENLKDGSGADVRRVLPM